MADDFLDTFETPYIDAQTLLAKLRDYTNPRDWISRQIKKGNLIRIKNGLYAISKRRLLLPQLANILYGPSYVSLHWALSYYGLIPERTKTVTSVTTRRNKRFHTPLGEFTYQYLSQERYSFGFTQLNESKEHFLIATPEKALVDFVHFYCEERSPKALLEELIEAHRFSSEDLRKLDHQLLFKMGLKYRSKIVTCLNQALKE